MLTPQHRAVLVLRDVEGLTYDEIAAVTETPAGQREGAAPPRAREFMAMLRANTYDWELPT